MDLICNVKFLENCAPDEKITIWTLQQRNAVNGLQENGKLHASSEYSFPQGCSVGKKSAYRWMQDQMTKRLEGYNNELPLWASIDKLTPNAPDDILIKAEIPRNRLLVHFYDPWETILQCFAMIESNGGAWPSSFLDTPYVAANEDDQIYVSGKNNCTSCYKEEECRISWERIFDLSLIDEPGFKWQKLHVTLSGISSDDNWELMSEK
uniref:Uncharacterized protein n=1 Tax=mine drainage metagenome TaxID=410659 RepID=E6QNU9_9ZZZZ